MDEVRRSRTGLSLGGPPRFAVTGLFLLALLYTFYFAKAVILPLVLAVLLSLLLSPVVRALHRLWIPRPLAAVLVLLALVSTLGFAAYKLADPAAEWLNRAPRDLRRLEVELRALKGPVEKVSEATQSVEKLTEVDDGGRRESVEVRPRSLSAQVFQGARRFVVTVVLMLILLFFLLASGDTFVRGGLAAVAAEKDRLKAADISRRLQRELSIYLLTITGINLTLGLIVGLAMWALGMPNPSLWGVMAAMLNFVPYLGAVLGISIVTLVSILTFDTLGPTVLPPLTYFLLTGIEGYFLTPVVVGNRLTLNPLFILLALIFWGWLWGAPGALLAVPMLACFKILCDYLPSLASIGRVLGTSPTTTGSLERGGDDG